jgi:hypothetical protein
MPIKGVSYRQFLPASHMVCLWESWIVLSEVTAAYCLFLLLRYDCSKGVSPCHHRNWLITTSTSMKCVLLKSTSHTLCYCSDIYVQSSWISIAFFLILTPLSLI